MVALFDSIGELAINQTPIATLSGDVTATTGPFFSSGYPQEVRNTQSRLPDVAPVEAGGIGMVIAAVAVLGMVILAKKVI